MYVFILFFLFFYMFLFFLCLLPPWRNKVYINMVVGLHVILRSEVCDDSSFLSDIADRPKRFAYCDT